MVSIFQLIFSQTVFWFLVGLSILALYQLLGESHEAFIISPGQRKGPIWMKTERVVKGNKCIQEDKTLQTGVRVSGEE